MKVSREQAAANRARVVGTAARLFRERGMDGIGVDGLMEAAGLTHGGFYRTFASKDALAAEAVSQAFGESVARWEKRIARSPDDAFAAIVGGYLSSAHCEQPGTGCAFPALGADGARRGPAVRKAFGDGLRAMIAALTKAIPARRAEAARERALATLAMLVGAVVLARAVDDPELSQDTLAAAARFLDIPAERST
jgi:TetR/AcrR family transcriptional regulator, transcriptional repressor for nem operon